MNKSAGNLSVNWLSAGAVGAEYYEVERQKNKVKERSLRPGLCVWVFIYYINQNNDHESQ
jgi:hypothetical protein